MRHTYTHADRQSVVLENCRQAERDRQTENYRLAERQTERAVDRHTNSCRQESDIHTCRQSVVIENCRQAERRRQRTIDRLRYKPAKRVVDRQTDRQL